MFTLKHKTLGRLLIVQLFLLGLPSLAHAQLDTVYVNPVAFDFGQIKIGDEVTVPVTITNDSSQSVSLAGGGVAEDGFSASSGCGGSVAAMSSCQLFYRFRPDARNSFQETTSLSLADGTDTKVVSLSMTGSGTESLARVFPVGVGFGPQPTGIEVSVPIRLSNNHGGALGGFAGGGVASPFQGSQNCASGVSPGGSCAFTYRFSPDSSGDFSDATSFSFSSGGILQRVGIQLEGEGISQSQLARVTPVTIDFGTQKRGFTVEVPITIENVTAGTLENFTGGGVSAPFQGLQNCAGGVAPGDSCEFTYRFTPDQEQEVVGSTGITFSSTTGGSQSVAIELRGRSTGTIARVSPVAIDFGTLPTDRSFTLPVTVFNDSASALDSFAGGGPGDPNFLASTTCGSGVTVGNSCRFNYTFAPVESGSVAAQTGFSFTNSSGLTEAIAIDLNGFGTDTLFADRFEQL